MTRSPYDLTVATETMAAVTSGISDDQLDFATPCPKYRVADLLAHVNGLAHVFALTARKELSDLTATAPTAALPTLPADWRATLPVRLADLAAAWQSPDAWNGMTQAGGVDLPGAVAGMVVLDELVVHGWDLARSTGQVFPIDDASVQGALGFLAQSTDPADRGDIFGPVVDVPPSAPPLTRALGLAGRDPDWTP